MKSILFGIFFSTSILFNIEYIFHMILNHTPLCLYWISILVMGGLIIKLMLKDLNRKKIIRIRKFFHLITIFMFAPPYVWRDHAGFVQLATAITIPLLILVELVRYQGNKSINNFFKPFLDPGKNESKGGFVTSHIQLLLAVLLPICVADDPLLRLTGLLTIGIGDSAAAIGGLARQNPHKLLGTRKTVEGLLSFVVSVWIAIWIAGLASIPAAVATVAAGIAECYTSHYDNVVVPATFSITIVAYSTLMQTKI